ncbi:hydroxyacylglutathione hydrolase [Endozoicomonadaceae bacterium StTr2]
MPSVNPENSGTESGIEIVQLPCLSDNYCSLVHHHGSDTTLVVDTPDAEAITRQLEQKGWSLDYILTTHHHWDHIDGHELLKEKFGCKIIGSLVDQKKIPGIDLTVSDDQQLQLGGINIQVLATPGHTLGHVCYWLPEAEAVFTGDTLFSLGCGRLFEGTAEQMWHSIQKIRSLPQKTMIYCGHEYTASNAKFAAHIDPENTRLLQRYREITELRETGLPTIPVSLKLEQETNPFMRADLQSLQQSLFLSDYSAGQVFAHIRKLKDQF